MTAKTPESMKNFKKKGVDDGPLVTDSVRHSRSTHFDTGFLFYSARIFRPFPVSFAATASPPMLHYGCTSTASRPQPPATPSNTLQLCAPL